MTKQILIRSGQVPVTSVLPLFNDVFPSIVSPDHRAYVDFFDGAAGAMNGRAVPVAPAGQAPTWATTTNLQLTGSGAAKPSATDAEARATIEALAAGGNGQWGATFLAGTVGAFGILFRRVAGNQQGYRAVIRDSGRLSIQRTNTGGFVEATEDFPFVYTPGDLYTMRVVAQGAVVEVFVNDAKVGQVSNATLSTLTRAGLFWQNSDAACLEFMGGS